MTREFVFHRHKRSDRDSRVAERTEALAYVQSTLCA